MLVFMYDDNGDAFGFKYNGTEYYYVRNAQNDITAVLDANQNIVASYVYDAWGQILSSTGDMAEINPLRYRGYYYDSETGYYYLNSRYYSPELCRFLNADSVLGANQDMLSYNLFSYCSNNPVRYSDYTGENAVAAAQILKWGSTISAIISQLDSPVPGPADVIALIVGIGVLVIAGIVAIPWSKVGSVIGKGWSWTTSKAKAIAVSASISLSISKSVTKAKTKIRNEKKRYDYWIASYVEYQDGRGTYSPTTPLSYSRAISYVRAGGNVFADSRNSAYKLAKAVGGGMPAHDPAHGGLGYWRHYHGTRGGRRTGGHIFYV